LKLFKFLKDLKNKMINQPEEIILPLGSDDFVQNQSEPTKTRRRPGPASKTPVTADVSAAVSTSANDTLRPKSGADKLFLVEGNVRLVPTGGAGTAVTSDQRRLVWAVDDDAAIAKYVAYFNEMSSFEGRYSVSGVSVTEAIR
jgi:hypothetical protein